VPLKLTRPVDWTAPKPDPLIVTTVPEDAEVGERPDMLGGTANTIPLLLAFARLTVTGPVEAPFGTGTTILLLVQLVGIAETPLNWTVPPDGFVPKLEPVMVTDVPGGPELGKMLLILGETVKRTALLAFPPAITTTGPLVAPAGTGVTIEPAVIMVGVATTPLNVTTGVAESTGLPVRNVPQIATVPPIDPVLGKTALIFGPYKTSGTITVES